MAIRTWKVTAEVNMDASKHDVVIVRTNLRKKVERLAEEAFRKKGYFHVTNMVVEQLKGD